ncbi:MAG: FHA domain-containing protein [Phycisphaerales bacterium JB063]
MRNVSLVMFKSDGTRRDFPLARERIIVGRKANCDLRIPLTSVSRQHCQISVEGEKISVKDLGSSNGTYHNSVRVQEASLSAGDELVVGPVVFTLVVDGEPSQIQPVRTIVANDEGVHESAGAQVGSAAGSPSASSVGSALDDQDADLDIPEMIDEEDASPTVDLDDPIAALEALASEDDSDDSDEFDDLDFFDDDDDDDLR